MTSVDPWRIYIFKEGLARFASESYSSEGNKSNRFVHLTNYSINKKNENYVQNINLETDDEGNKWSLSALSKYLESIGVDMSLLWSRIYDIIIKSFLCVDSHIYTATKKIQGFKNNCFELYGFDVLIDANLTPWILEANLSPSLATDSPLDIAIKTNLITDTFNLISIRKMDRRRDNVNKIKQRFKNFSKSKQNQTRGFSSSKNPNISRIDSNKHSDAQEFLSKNRLFCENLSQISLKNRALIRDTLTEDFRKGNFIRIYPSKNSNIYDKYFITPRVSHKIVYKYLFTDEVITWEVPRNFVFSSYNKIGMEYSNIMDKKPKSSKCSSSTVKVQKLPQMNKKKLTVLPENTMTSYNPASAPPPADFDSQNTEKLMITGDDVLIEYVARLMIAIKSIKEKLLRQSWKQCIDKFIRHYVWHTSDVRRRENNRLWQRLESRLIEMKERRKRLLRSLYKKEITVIVGKKKKEEINAIFEKDYEAKEQQKNVIIQALSALELEDMLRKSTKNVAHEVVSCLIESSGRGVLTDIIRWLTTSQHNMLNDHLSILDSSDIGQSSRFKDYGEEEPEDYEEVESFYNTKSTMNTSGIRIKVRKSSVDPHSKKKTWQNKNIGSTNLASKYGQGIVNKSNNFQPKPNRDIEIETENVRAGSPLNYVRGKKRKTRKGSQTTNEENSGKGSLIVMQPVQNE